METGQQHASIINQAGESRPASPVLVSLSSSVRAWCYLVWLSILRQARLRQMVGISLALLVLSVVWIRVERTLESSEFLSPPPAVGRPTYLIERYPPRPDYTMHRWKTPRTRPMTIEQWLAEAELRLAAVPAPTSSGLGLAVLSCGQAALESRATPFYIFSNNVLIGVFITFLLPIWSLGFATNALGGEREAGNLVWTLTRPLPRWSIYLAKFAALLPWALVLNLGGFAAICWAAGQPGPRTFALYWPAIFWSTMAFAALFHLMGAWFQRPAIVAIVYCFFLETILGNMPGYMKRVSIGFYARCMMFQEGQEYGVQPDNPSIYLPVDGDTARWVLIGATIALLALGTLLFSRKEYQEIA